MKTIIHVNQHIIRSNLKNKENQPVLTVKTHKSNTYAHTVEIHGPSRVVYSPNKPLSCGARVWIETQAEVVTDWEWLGKKVKEHSGAAHESETTDHESKATAKEARTEDHGPRE